MATSLAIAGIGAAGAIGGSLLSGGGSSSSGVTGANKKMQNRAIFNQEVAAGTADINNRIWAEQAVQTERARQGVMGILGMPGTYEESYEDYVAGGGGPGISAPTGQFNLVQISEPLKAPIEALPGKGKGIYTGEEFKSAKHWKKTMGLTGTELDQERQRASGEGWILDPDAYIKNISQTRQFRMVSRMTAEADQLARQDGPMWEKLKQSVQSPILQAAAVGARETQEAISRDAARGGSARNRAVAVANTIRSNNEILNNRANALWVSSIAVKQWTVDNARMQLAFNQSWVSNLDGIRDNFQGMMQSAQQFYGAQILPSVVGASGNVGNMASSNNSLMGDIARAQADRDASMGNLVGGIVETIGGGLLTGLANRGGGGTNSAGVASGGYNAGSNLSGGAQFAGSMVG